MRKRVVGYAFVAPAVVHLVLFALVPIAFALYLSFFNWDLLRDKNPFVGLGNYADLAQDNGFWRAMGNSLLYTAVSVPLGLVAALGIAVLVAKPLRGLAFFRTVFYLPSVMSQVATAMVWIYILLPKTGFVNTVLGWFGLPSETDFLNQVGWAMAALVFMSVWTGLGPRMVLYLAGIMGIPDSLYEAASLDGASKRRQFWAVTLPMLAPTTLFVTVTSTIAAMQVFTPVYMMTKGGPLDTTDMVGYHIYTTAWRDFHVGEASAQSFVLLAVVMAVSWFQFRLQRSQLEGYSAA
ncbi:MAG: sugar ABC transporter permease [Fimbriimonadaceae bacterium]|nr:sugar ABC transporter permease [Fimbriimonadaceae bacterium]